MSTGVAVPKVCRAMIPHLQNNEVCPAAHGTNPRCTALPRKIFSNEASLWMYHERSVVDPD